MRELCSSAVCAVLVLAVFGTALAQDGNPLYMRFPTAYMYSLLCIFNYEERAY